MQKSGGDTCPGAPFGHDASDCTTHNNLAHSAFDLLQKQAWQHDLTSDIKGHTKMLDRKRGELIEAEEKTG